MLKKSIALLMVLLLCVGCAVSCAKKDENAPDGMKSATLSGEPFRLYVPESWSLNTASGISGALYNSSHKILVSARSYAPADAATTLDGYVDLCAARYAETLKDFEILSREAALLGGENAVRLNYRITDGTEAMTCFQITAAYGGEFVSLHGYCASELYEARTEDYNAIIEAFVLCEATDPKQEPVIDKNTPEGFQIASADHLEYRLYVPLSWICDAENGASDAYAPEAGRPNVSVTSYSPELSMDIEDYFLNCEESYKTVLPQYERVSVSDRTVSERPAKSYTYRTTVDGQSYTVMQTVLIYNQMVYSFTYTALSERFDTYISDVEAMLNVFTFR